MENQMDMQLQEAAMIEVTDISMHFQMPGDRLTSLKEYVIKFLKGQLKFKKFVALDHVNFEVKKGEVMGLIGHNGAGKSTILKVISGILKPTTGNVVLRANVVPMLELGSGFDLEMTGRENIYLNGAILGYSEAFLKSKYEEIIEFAELGDYIDQPVRTYSSGMKMRLGFAINVNIEPDVLVIDEALAVGDASFKRKCKDKIKEIMGKGTTVLYVSHSADSVREICPRSIYLRKGTVIFDGPTNETLKVYQEYKESQKNKKKK
jgi:ABC-type polysaccharide/polyol phosphate transport system ATPase subunit